MGQRLRKGAADRRGPGRAAGQGRRTGRPGELRIGAKGGNTGLAGKARGSVAYALFDVESPITKAQIAELRAIEGVLRVFVIDGKQA